MNNTEPDWKGLCAVLARTLAELAARHPDDPGMRQMERHLRLIAAEAAND